MNHKNPLSPIRKGFLLENENADLIRKIIADLSQALEVSGERGYWQKRLEIYKNYPKLGSEWGCDIVGIYIRLGDKENAFAELERS